MKASHIAFSSLVLAVSLSGCVGKYGFAEQKSAAQLDTSGSPATNPAPSSGSSPLPSGGANPSPAASASPVPSPSGTVPFVDLPPASERMYAQSSGSLYSIDSVTLMPTLIGNFHSSSGRPVDLVLDIAISLDGVMTGISCRGAIYQIDPATAEVFPVLGLSGGNGLTFTSTGKLIASSANISVIDLATRDVAVLPQDRNFTSSGDIVGLPDGFLYESVFGTGGDDLVRINPTTGKTDRIGSIGFSAVYGLGYANGKLYGFTEAGQVIQIDIASGRGTLAAQTGVSFYGATTNPVRW
ncbi:MAG: hypothetical protein H7301_10410 [Cryobacterium sp.]|nr:hypothetical protein [Oligoflexia bacterium]